jgi:hypothetical protein
LRDVVSDIRALIGLRKEKSMSVVKYDVTVSPSAPSITIGMEEIDANSVKIKVIKIGSFKLTLSPAGNWAQKVLSGIIWPIAALLALAIPGKIRSKVEGKEVNAPTSQTIGYSFNVEGVDIEIDADKLTLSTYNGMLMTDGTVKVK